MNQLVILDCNILNSRLTLNVGAYCCLSVNSQVIAPKMLFKNAVLYTVSITLIEGRGAHIVVYGAIVLYTYTQI